MEKPVPVNNPDFSKLKKICARYILEIADENYCDDGDYDYYIYEAAMTAIYGEDVWGWINERLT